MPFEPGLKRDIVYYPYKKPTLPVSAPIKRFRKRRALAILVIVIGFLSTTYPISNNSHPQKAEASTTSPTELFSKLTEYPSSIPTKKPNIYAKTYMLIDDASSEVIIEKDARTPYPIASVTKMTTALVALKELPLDKVVEVRKSATQVIGSKINLRTGEKITILNLIKGLLIMSGNDAAYTLAQAYSDSDEITPFVDKMNEFVKNLGLKDTVYDDPAGLSEVGKSTAFDQVHIARLLLRTSPLDTIVATTDETVYSADQAISHPLKNSNRLIRSDENLYLSGVVGVKTGFTNEAGHCLIAAYKVNDRLYIGAVLNTTESTITASAAEMRKLFLWSNTVEFKPYF